MRSATQPYSIYIYIYIYINIYVIAIRLCRTALRFFPQNFGTINEFYQGLRHRLTAKALGPRLSSPLFEVVLPVLWAKLYFFNCFYYFTQSGMIFAIFLRRKTV